MSTPAAKRKTEGGKARQKVGAALSTHAIEYLRGWMMSPEHVEHPYPNEQEKVKIMQETGITSKQLTCWFSNNRKRFWKPKMEEMGRHDVVEAAMGNTLSPQTIEYLKGWMMHPDHIQNPYPTEEEKTQIMAATGIEKKQLTCWFSNNRKRFWKPKMDKIREQYGLSESEPLPPALLATAAVPAPAAAPAPLAPPPGDISHDILAAEILLGAAPTVDASFFASAHPLETSYAPVPAFPLESSAAPLEAPVAPVAALPLESSYAPVPTFPLEAVGAAALPLDAGAGAVPASAVSLEVAPAAPLPFEHFPANFFDAAVEMTKPEEQPDIKRQKVSLDDVIPV